MSSPVVMRTHTQFVETHFTVKGRSGDEYDVLCPAHGDRNASMRINVAKGLFFCHGCHVGGGMKKLAHMIGVRYTWDRTEETMGILMAKLDALNASQGIAAPTFLPESTLLQYKGLSDYWTRARGFNAGTVELFDLGYDMIAGAAVIPVRNIHGHLLGVTKRYLDPESSMKYKDPKGFDKKHNLFGSWLAAEHPSPTVALVEGPTDTMSVWQSARVGVGQYGSYITPEQVKILRRMGTTCVVLMYDDDEGGRIARSGAFGFREKKGEKSEKSTWLYSPERDLRRFFIVKRVSYKGINGKDPNEVLRNEGPDCIAYMIDNSRYLV